MLKIKVNLDKKTIDTLTNDILLFKITKKDGTINKNKFMNILFENYQEEYRKKEDTLLTLAKSLKDKYNIQDDSFAIDFLSGLNDLKFKDKTLYYTSSLTFTLTDENEFIFNSTPESSLLGASQYFRRLIANYLENPQYIREQIIYKDIFLKLTHAIENKRLVKLRLEKEDIITIPYKLSTSKEEIYTYLLNYKNNTPSSIHLMKIKQVIELKDKFSLSKDETSLLDEILRLGIQFPFKNKCLATIELSKEGVRQFNSKYLHRPIPDKIEGNTYYFGCSYDQLLLYFSSFGASVTIHSPDYLANSIYKIHKSFVTKYES